MVEIKVVGCPFTVVVTVVGMGESYVMVSVVACPPYSVVIVVTPSTMGPSRGRAPPGFGT